jgi:hypothetical protein
MGAVSRSVLAREDCARGKATDKDDRVGRVNHVIVIVGWILQLICRRYYIPMVKIIHNPEKLRFRRVVRGHHNIDMFPVALML